MGEHSCAQTPGGRGGTPDTARPPGTTTVTCTTCGGSGTRLVERNTGAAASTPCFPCRGDGTVDVFWRTSPWDNQSHLFRVDSAPAFALCTHSVPRDRLTRDAAARACVACTMALAELAAPGLAERAQWAT